MSTYEIRIRGRVGPTLLRVFASLSASVEPVETVLHGPVRDQAELHALLHRIEDLGLELVEVRRLHVEAEAADRRWMSARRSPAAGDPPRRRA